MSEKTKLYVGNISYETTEASLRDAFGQDGRVVADVKVIKDRESGRPRGFAFVEMASAEDAQAAIDVLNGQSLDGRTITVNEARDRSPGGGGGGRSFGPPRGGSGGDRGGRNGGGGGGGNDFGRRPRRGGGGGGGRGGDY